MSILPFTRSSKLAAALAVSLVAAIGTARAQTTLYTQASATEDAYYAWGSTVAPDGAPSLTYDNFQLGTAANVSVVQWEGIYIDDMNLADNPASPNTTSFEISFWSDNSGQPGTKLATTDLAPGDCNPVVLGDIEFDFSDTSSVQVPHITYSAALLTPFTAAAGVTYWVSVQSTSLASEPGWALYSGEGGDGKCVQDYAGTRYTRSSDIRFSLLGDVVTTPTVSVAPTTPVAHLGGAAGVYTFSISPAQSAAVKVHYKLKGTAANGTDYVTLDGVAKIRPGKSSATIQVTPEGNLGGAGSKKVKLVLEPESAYLVGTADPVVVKILNH